MTHVATPDNPLIQRIGKVERKFRAMADAIDMSPGDMLIQLMEEGVTQVQLAEHLECTRQAVAILATRYGLEFPGAKVDIDDVARQVSGASDFQDYIDKFWGELTQTEMADQLGVSLSTLKRRCKEANRPSHVKRGRRPGKDYD